MDYETILIPLSKLQLNIENDRHGPLGSQQECIQWMLQHLGDEIYSLAKDIAQHGLSPLDGILVIPADDEDSGEYIVWEGNRRITALKLLEDPNRCEDPKHIRRFQELRSSAAEIPSSLQCILAPSVEDADRLIELRHQGRQGGVGTVPWDSAQKTRHMARRGKRGRYAYTQEVIDSILDKLDDDLIEEVQRPGFPISTLDRLLRNENVREFLGLVVDNGKPKRVLPEEETLKGLTKILRDIANNDLPVSRVYSKEDQRKYIEEFEPESRPDQTRRLDEAQPVEPTSASVPSPTAPRRRSRPSARDRKKLIPPSVRYRINDDRLNDIYHDLRGLKVHEFANATAVLFRVFLELATELYLDKQGIEYHSYSDPLHKKVAMAIEDAKRKGWLDREAARHLNKHVTDRNSLFGADALNAYVHSRYFHPVGRDLNTLWDNMQPYFDAIINHLD